MPEKESVVLTMRETRMRSAVSWALDARASSAERELREREEFLRRSRAGRMLPGGWSGFGVE